MSEILYPTKFVIEPKKTWRNQEYYFLNAPKGVEPQRRSGYYPEK